MPKKAILFIRPVLSQLHQHVPALCCADTIPLWEHAMISVVKMWPLPELIEAEKVSLPLASCLFTWIIFNLDHFSNHFYSMTACQKKLSTMEQMETATGGRNWIPPGSFTKPTVHISAQVQKQSETIMKILLKVYIQWYCMRHIGLLASNLSHNLNSEILNWKPVEEIKTNFPFKTVYLNTWNKCMIK